MTAFRIGLALAALAIGASGGSAAAQFLSTYLDRPLTGERLPVARTEALLKNDPTASYRALADRFRGLALEYDGRDEYGWKSDYDYRLLNSLTWSLHRNLDMKAMLATEVRKLVPTLDDKRAALAALDPTKRAERAAIEAELPDLERRLAVAEEDMVVQDEITSMLTADLTTRIAARRKSGAVPAPIAAYHGELEALLADIP